MTLERAMGARWLAASMAVVLVGWTAALAGTATTGVSGTVILGADDSVLAGATVHLSDGDGRLVSSEKTGADGSFRIAGVPAGAYRVAVEHEGGLYLVGDPIRVEADQPVTLNLAIAGTPAGALPVSPLARDGAGALLSSPLAATLLVAGSAMTVGALIESATSDDNEPVASQFLTP